MVSWSLAPAEGVVLAAVIRYALAVVAETVRLIPAPPVEVEAKPPLSETFRVAVSAFFATRIPPTELTPLEKVISSEVPSLTAEPVLPGTVGPAPLKEGP